MTQPRAVHAIPMVVEVQGPDGQVTQEMGEWLVAPPPSSSCQVCGRAHDPDQPHDALSLYYAVTFRGMIGRDPTWADAMAHCAPEVQEAWRAGLLGHGAWSEPPAGEVPVRHHGVE